jgi:ADP-ribosylglycohydrolase
MSPPKQAELLLPSLPIEKVHGALLGAAVGDALGWPQEYNARRVKEQQVTTESLTFQTWRRRCGGRFSPYEEYISAGEYSDDTQLLLATARSLLYGEQWAKYLSHYELPLWLLYERGGGGATKRAAASWHRNIPPWSEENAKEHARYYEAGGNGVAMRVLPHVLPRGQTESQLLRDVLRNGILTHGHPRALLSARVYAQAAWTIAHTPPPLAYGAVIEAVLDSQPQWERLPDRVEGAETSATHWLERADKHSAGGYLATWRMTVEELHRGLLMCRRALAEGALANDYTVLQSLGCFERSSNGSGVTAALAALYLFAAHAADPLVGLRTIAFASSADTDTLASMLGGLFGLSHGLEWIPDTLQHVQDHALIADVAAQLIQTNRQRAELPRGHWSQRDEHDVLARLEAESTHDLTLGVLGKAIVLGKRSLKALTKNLVVNEWQLRTAFGQTLYIKHLRKNAQQRVTPPGVTGAAHTQTSPALDDRESMPRHMVANLLNDFAHALPLRVSGEAALRVVARIVATPQPTEKVIQAMLADLVPDLSVEEQRLLTTVSVKHLAADGSPL